MEILNLNILTIIIFGVIITGVILGFLFFIKRQKNFNKNFNLLAVKNTFYIKYIFLLISFIILLFSIFDLRIGEKQTSGESKGIDMIFVLDVSKSMNVADINDSKYSYTRLDVMKDSISKFVLSHTEDRFGLVIFAGDAISTVPLTIDHDIFLTFLKNVDYRNLVKQGSDFEKALSLGIDRFNNSENRSKVIMFISDGGEDDDKINSSNIKDIISNNEGINYFTIGVGTDKGGKIILGKDVFGRMKYQTYNNRYVISKINRNNLKNINKSLDGEYLEVTNINDLLKLNKYIDKLDKNTLKKSIDGDRPDGGRILSIISFIFFIIFSFIYLTEGRIRGIKN